MEARILTLRELNRATLARQFLLERSHISAFDAIAHLVGLQAQTSNAPYIGLWTRLQHFHHNDLTQLFEQRRVVRATLMRATLHLVTAEDYMLLRPTLQPALIRALNAFFGPKAKNLDIEQLVTLAHAYVEEKPRSFPEIRTQMTLVAPEKEPELLAYAVRTHLPLVQIPPGGTWNVGGSPFHANAASWLGSPLPQTSDVQTLILRYLAAFGPATVKDMQTWSGLSSLKNSVEALRLELRSYRDEQGNELFDLLENDLHNDTDTPIPPRFLPEFDNLILSHADRRRVVANEYRSSIYLSAGRVRATFLVDGFVAGTWKVEKTRGVTTMVIEPFKPPSEETRHALTDEGEQLVRFMADDAERVKIEFHYL